MKAALRTCWLIFAPTPLLRAVTLVGLALFVGGQLFVVSGLRFLGMLSLLGLAFMLIVPVFMGGVLLRMLGARRSGRLVPSYRLHVLAGAAIALLTACSLLALQIALFGIGRSQDTQPFFGFTLALACGSVLWIALFSMTCSPVGPIITLPLWLLLPWALNNYMPRGLGAVLLQPARLLLFTLLLWSGFAVWFCLRRKIAAVDFANHPGFLLSAPKKGKELQNPAAMLLNPNAEGTRWWQQFVPFILLGLFLLSSHAPDSATPSNTFLLSYCGVIATFTPFISAWIICRRAKWLWLRRADRTALFQTSEAVLWRQSLPSLLSVLVVAPVVAWLTPGQTTTLLFVIAGAAMVLPCNVYLGLCWTRSVNAVDLLLATVVGLYSILILALSSRGTLSFTFVLTLVCAPVVAFGLRRLALSRWSTIDWLDAKPPRNLSGLWRQTT